MRWIGLIAFSSSGATLGLRSSVRSLSREEDATGAAGGEIELDVSSVTERRGIGIALACLSPLVAIEELLPITMADCERESGGVLRVGLLTEVLDVDLSTGAATRFSVGTLKVPSAQYQSKQNA